LADISESQLTDFEQKDPQFQFLIR